MQCARHLRGNTFVGVGKDSLGIVDFNLLAVYISANHNHLPLWQRFLMSELLGVKCSLQTSISTISLALLDECRADYKLSYRHVRVIAPDEKQGCLGLSKKSKFDL